MGRLREELQRVQIDQQTGSGQSQAAAPPAADHVDVSELSRDAAERLLVDCLTSAQFPRALTLMKNLRYQLPSFFQSRGFCRSCSVVFCVF